MVPSRGEPLTPGRWQLRPPYAATLGPFIRLTVELGTGWHTNADSRGAGLRIGGASDEDAVARLKTAVLRRLLAPEGCPTDVGEIGPTVDELAVRLASEFSAEVVDIAIGGFRGKQVAFTTGDGEPACGRVTGWVSQNVPYGEAWEYAWQPGWRWQITILDLAGTRYVIEAGARADAPAETWAELERVVASAQFEGVYERRPIEWPTEDVIDAATISCEGLAYVDCVTDFIQAAERTPGALVAICDYANGEGEVRLHHESNNQPCSSSGGAASGQVFRFVTLPCTADPYAGC